MKIIGTIDIRDRISWINWRKAQGMGDQQVIADNKAIEDDAE